MTIASGGTGPATISVNGVRPPSGLSVCPSGELLVAIQNDPGGQIYVSMHVVPSGNLVDWMWIDGARGSQPSGPRQSVLRFAADKPQGVHEFHLVDAQAGRLLDTSSRVTITASPGALTALSVNGVKPPAGPDLLRGASLLVGVENDPCGPIYLSMHDTSTGTLMDWMWIDWSVLPPASSTVAPGGNLDVRATNDTTGLRDWVGMFLVGAPLTDYRDWQWRDGSRRNAPSGIRVDRQRFPASQVPGVYEFRLVSNGIVMARSGPITVCEPARITSPWPGWQLPGSAATFAWTAGSGVDEYWLEVRSPGVPCGFACASTGTTRTRTVSGLPTDGSAVEVRLYSRMGDEWTAPHIVIYKAWTRTSRGVCFGPYLQVGTRPGDPISALTIDELLAIVAPHFSWVRFYGSLSGLAEGPRLAKARGLLVATTAWLGADPVPNRAELEALKRNISQGLVDLVIVGSEAIYGGTLDEAQLIAYIREIRAHVKASPRPDVPVTTNEHWETLRDHPDLVAECDVVLANMYAFNDGVPIEQSDRAVSNYYLMLRAKYAPKEVVYGETGWATGGNPPGGKRAVPSLANAATYLVRLATWAREDAGARVFAFEAFDEPGKSKPDHEYEAFYGIWDNTRALKAGMQRVLDCVLEREPGGAPGIQFLTVPPTGSQAHLVGSVTNVDPATCGVAVYILVGGVWWTKPTYASPVTIIDKDFSWDCNIVTGGADATATRIAAFLIPGDYTPPKAEGHSATLPAELDQHAYAKVEVTR
ncbi:MAG: hypothetical protein HY815_17000 [Candidatus Riflebacteria bacterium]|nr:hypothetical protein [Candidatus Riflebacteria bacterium]